MDLNELVKRLLEHADRNAVINAIQTGAREIFQAIWQQGHDKAYGDAKQRERDNTTRITTLESELAAERQARTDAESKAPDVAKVHSQYQGEIASLKQAAKEREDKLKKAMHDLRVDTIVANIETRLADQSEKGGRFTPKYAHFLANSYRNRIDPKEDGTYDLRQATRPDLPMAAPSDGDYIGLLIKEATDDPENHEFIISRVDGGSGTGGGARGSAGGGGKPVDALTKVREQRAAENKAKPNPLAGVQ